VIDANGLPAKEVRGRVLDARLHLLDRQILNADGDPVGTVDDVEFDGVESGAEIAAGTAAPRVSALLSGHVLATRILGGRPPLSRLQSVPWRLVRRVGIVVELNATDMSFDALWVERWLRDHVVARIPGGRHAAQ
jgi:sporulation protein YlmC with PRC-barrel domain